MRNNFLIKLLLFFTFVINIILFFIGFHNIDLGYNLHIINCENNLNLIDVSLNGIIYEPSELYLLGLNQVLTSFLINIILFFLIGVSHSK
jgi:hypothetical protein